MKKKITLFFLTMFLTSSYSQKQDVLLDLDCSSFKISAQKDMSISSSPHNWKSAMGVQWESNNVFAVSLHNGINNYIGNAIRFGSALKGNGQIVTPTLDLSVDNSQKIILKINITSGSNKEGIINISVDGKTIGEISAMKGNNGKKFSKEYYPYEFIITGGDKNSHIIVKQLNTDSKGYIYMNEFKIIKTYL